jgi:hypothetical protein
MTVPQSSLDRPPIYLVNGVFGWWLPEKETAENGYLETNANSVMFCDPEIRRFGSRHWKSKYLNCTEIIGGILSDHLSCFSLKRLYW